MDWFKKHWRRLASVALLLLFVLFAAVVLVRDAQTLLSQPLTLNPWLVALAFLVSYGGLIITILVWRRILRVFVGGATLWQDFRIYIYSMLGFVVPGRVWAAVGRVVLYERHGIAGWQVAAASAVEFVITGVAALLVFGVTTAVSGLTSWWQNPIVALLCFGLAILLLQPPIFNHLVQWVWQRAQPDKPFPMAIGYRDLLLWVTAEMVVISIGGLATYILLQSLFPVSAALLVPVTSAWSAAVVTGTFLFWLPSPVVRDGMMAFVLTQALPTATAVLFAILARVWSIVSILLLATLVWGISRVFGAKLGEKG